MRKTIEGFIKALGHPRKKQLAEILLDDNATIAQVAEAGFDRISALEMARQIKQNVEGMESFSIVWPRNSEIKASPIHDTPFKPVDTAETDSEDQSNVETSEVPTAPADVVVPPVEETTAPADTTADVSSETVPTPTADQIQVDAPAAPVAPELPATPAQPAAPVQG